MRLRDKQVISRGYDHGNFANAYETTSYTRALRSLTGARRKSNNFVIGFTAGFFSSYEDTEIPEMWLDAVKQCREVMRKETPWIAVD